MGRGFGPASASSDQPAGDPFRAQTGAPKARPQPRTRRARSLWAGRRPGTALRTNALRTGRRRLAWALSSGLTLGRHWRLDFDVAGLGALFALRGTEIFP